MTSVTTPSLSPFAGFLQIAYVCTDLTQAIAHFSQKEKVSKWVELRELPIEVQPGKQAILNVGLAFVGATQIELIQPVGGHDAIYRDALPAQGFALRFHHLAQLIESEEAFERQRSELAAQGTAIPVDGQSPGMARYFYTDRRATLGHYMEHIWYSPTGLAHMAQMPRN